MTPALRAVVLAALTFTVPIVGNAACRQAIALGLDVSGSVDAREYRAQLDGVASALSDPRVRAAILSFPQRPVEILVYEWSGPGDTALLLPWTPMRSGADIDAAADILRNVERRIASPGTALGMAMQVGVAYLDQRKTCPKRVLDISGDGKSNLGPRPQDVRPLLEGLGITINALVIGTDDPVTGGARQAGIAELSSYFNAYVILGEGAFVETALGFSDYADAMARKLLREIEVITLSALPKAERPAQEMDQ